MSAINTKSISQQAEFYFSPRYRLEKNHVIDDLTRAIDLNAKFEKGELTASDIVGTGIKRNLVNGIAAKYLKQQIEMNRYLLENFDEKNQLTSSQVTT